MNEPNYLENLYNLYEGIYIRELEEKEKINSSVTIQLTLVSLMFGGLLFMLKEMPIHSRGSLLIAFSSIAIAGVLLFIDVILIFRIVRNYAYETLPDSAIIDKYRSDLKKSPAGVQRQDHDLEFLRNIMQYYIDCTSINMQSNSKKYEARKIAYDWLFRTWIVYFLVLAVFILMIVSTKLTEFFRCSLL